MNDPIFTRATDAWVTRLDADGDPVGDRIKFNDDSLWIVRETDEVDTSLVWPVSRTIDIPTVAHHDLIRTLMEPWKSDIGSWEDMYDDGHPDNLIVSNAYPDFVAGWYVLDATGTAYTRATTVPQQSLCLSVCTATEDGVGTPRLSGCYHHPSLEYLSEIARQIRTGERRVFGNKHTQVQSGRWVEARVWSTRVSRWTGGELHPVETRYAGVSDRPEEDPEA